MVYVSGSAGADRYSVLSSLMNTFITSLLCYSIKNEEREHISYSMVMFACVVANVFGGLNVFFLRVSTNINVFQIILIPYIWFNSRNPKTIKIILVCYALIIFIKAIVKNFGMIVPYSFYGA